MILFTHWVLGKKNSQLFLKKIDKTSKINLVEKKKDQPVESSYKNLELVFWIEKN